MLSLLPNTLFAIFAVVCSLLLVKAQVLGALTAATRGRLKRFINKEDAEWLGGEHVATDDERVQRIFRAHRNDLENLVPFFIGGLLFLASGASSTAGIAYFCLFLLARFLHTFAYLHDFEVSRLKARLRNATYTLGWLVTIVMGLHAAVVALQSVMS